MTALRTQRQRECVVAACAVLVVVLALTIAALATGDATWLWALTALPGAAVLIKLIEIAADWVDRGDEQ